jgi:hypothetical protein
MVGLELSIPVQNMKVAMSRILLVAAPGGKKRHGSQKGSGPRAS